MMQFDSLMPKPSEVLGKGKKGWEKNVPNLLPGVIGEASAAPLFTKANTETMEL